VRVREELTHHPKGTRPVAEGHVGKAASNREPELAADMSGEPLPFLEEGHAEFTMVPEVE